MEKKLIFGSKNYVYIKMFSKCLCFTHSLLLILLINYALLVLQLICYPLYYIFFVFLPMLIERLLLHLIQKLLSLQIPKVQYALNLINNKQYKLKLKNNEKVILNLRVANIR